MKRHEDTRQRLGIYGRGIERIKLKKAVNIITAMYMGFELTVKDNLFLKFGEDGYVYQKSYIESIQEWIWTTTTEIQIRDFILHRLQQRG